MKKDNLKKVILILRILLGIVFLLSAIGKMADFVSFSILINNITTVGDTKSILISSFIIGIEMLIGAFLVTNIQVREACLLAVLALIVIFIPFTIYALGSSNVIDCGCFGAISILNTDNQILNLLKNILLIVGLSVVLIREKNNKLNYKFTFIASALFIIPIFSFNFYVLPETLSLVKVVELKNYLENANDYILIDARDRVSYQRGHIPNAISIPYKKNATDLTQLKTKLSKEKSKKVLTYCDAASCNLSKLLALHISKQFNITTYELEGGIHGWKKQKL